MSGRFSSRRGPVRDRRGLIALVATGVAAGLLAAPASAFHIPGATYTGTHSAGGTIELEVSADGTAITAARITNLVGTACTIPARQTSVDRPIVEHGFSVARGGFTVEGRFFDVQRVRGTLSDQTCATGTVRWSARTGASPARSEECIKAERRVRKAKNRVRRAREAVAEAETAAEQSAAEEALANKRERLRDARRRRRAVCR